MTTGVWMGRDDAKAVPGLQGGTAPARAFAQFMKLAVAQRPVEPFETALTLPDWQLEPDDIANLSGPDAYVPTDDNTNPGNNPTDNQPAPAANQDFLDNATGRQGQGQGQGDNTRKRTQPTAGI